MSLLNDASLVFIPSGYKEDKVYSIIPSNGAGDLDFVRGCDATRINPQSLVEGVSWNLVQYSEDFTNAAWIKYQATASSNSVLAPNGTTTADTLSDNAASDVHIAFQILNLKKGLNTISIYAKANTLSNIVLQFFDGTSSYASNKFDLANGTTTGANQSIENIGNGWYRCIFSADLPTSANTYCYVFLNNGSTNSYVGSGQGLYIWGYQINVGSTAKPYFPTTDRLNVPRLDYTNSTCPSLLLEKQSTNIALYSEQFNNAAWTTDGLTVSANSALSPDGTQNADKLISNNASGNKFIYQINTVSSGTSYTASAYFKSSEYSYAYFRLGGVTGNPYVIYNLTNQSLVATSGSVTHSIQLIGNGWYRINLIVTSTSTIIAPVFSFLPSTGYTIDANNLPLYTGNGVNGGFIWGAQLEASSYPTSYIPTTSATATRLVDSCYKTGISSLIGQTEGTLFVDINPKDFQAASYIGISDGSATNRIILGFESSGNANSGILYTFGLVSFPNTFTANRDQRLKIAIAYKSGDNAFYINGNLIASNNNTFSGIFNQGGFNWDIPGQPFKGNANQFILWKRRLTNTELAQLTTI